MEKSIGEIFIGFSNKFGENKYIITDKLRELASEFYKSNKVTLGYLISHDDILNAIFEPDMEVFITSVMNGEVYKVIYFTIKTIDMLKNVLSVIEQVTGTLDVSVYLEHAVILNDNNIRIAPEIRNGRLENEKND